MKLVLAVSTALALAGACTSAPAAPGQTAAAATKEEKICKEETVVGRYVPVKTCHTQAEWDAIKAKQAQGVKDADRAVRAAAGTTPN